MASVGVQQKLRDGIRRHQTGDIAGAARVYSEILSEDVRNADAWHLSGLIAFQHRQHADAETCIRQALSLRPAQTEFLSNLASVLLAVNRETEAEQVCRDVLRRHPEHAGAWQRLGSSLLKQGRYDAAQQALHQAVQLQPKNADALCNLGVACIERRQFADAERYLLRARSLARQSMQVHLNLGVAQRETGKLDAAADSLNQAVQLAPQSSDCFLNRGNVHLDRGEIDAALSDFQQAVTLNPRQATALNGLGRVLQVLGHCQQAMEAFELACQLDAPRLRFAGNRLYCASLTSSLSSQQLFQLHADWGRQIEAAIPPVDLPLRLRSATDRLKIGYVSPDFWNHATMRFFLPLLQNHDRDRLELVCYSETVREDSTTARVRANCDVWRTTSSLSDQQLVQQILDDEIDVLVDLAGHTAGNRLPVFAARPAQVQVSFLGYPLTTGLSRIDYRFSDAMRDGAWSAGLYTEELFYLPHGACSFEPPDSCLSIADPPSAKNGCLTFGSTHRLEKISAECLEVWSDVLQAVPDSRLFVFRDVLRQPMIRERFLRQLQAAGVDCERVELGWELPADHLELYSRIDILLDVFPWGSGTTAYEAMWMGVPIPTIAGDRPACRATASMLHFSGFPELIAESRQQYVQLVARLAANESQRARLRQQLRPAMAATVCDGQGFAADVEAAYRTMLARPCSPALTSATAGPLPEPGVES